MADTYTVRLSSKGQLVIPLELREKLGLGAGDTLVLHLLSDRLLLAEVPPPSPFEAAVAELRRDVAERGITRQDVERMVAEVSAEVYGEQPTS